MNELKKEICHFTHNDLDCIGCMLVLEYATPGIKKTTFHTNYQNIHEQTQEVINFVYKHQPSLLVISDISFASEKPELLALQELQDTTSTKIIFFDHHEYDDGYFDDMKMKIIYNKSKAATGVMQEYFQVQDEHLNKLCNIINAFDIWLESEKVFPLGLGVNDYFWNEHKNKNKSLEQISYEIVENGYRLPEDFKEYFKNYTNAYTDTLNNLKAKQLFVNDGFTALVFTDKYFNEALYESFTKNGNKVALIVNSYGIIRIRYSTVEPLSVEIREAIKIEILGKLAHGHLNAYSIKVDNSNFEKIMLKVQELTAIINKYKGK